LQFVVGSFLSRQSLDQFYRAGTAKSGLDHDRANRWASSGSGSIVDQVFGRRQRARRRDLVTRRENALFHFEPRWTHLFVGPPAPPEFASARWRALCAPASSRTADA